MREIIAGLPFVKAGVPAIDLIDFDYPPWHTDGDTIDQLSSQSLEIVGSGVPRMRFSTPRSRRNTML